MEIKGFFQREIIINGLVSSSELFEYMYLCYGSATIKNMFTLTARGSTLDVYRRQILTTTVDPCAVKVNVCQHKQSVNTNSVCVVFLPPHLVNCRC